MLAQHGLKYAKCQNWSHILLLFLHLDKVCYLLHKIISDHDLHHAFLFLIELLSIFLELSHVYTVVVFFYSTTVSPLQVGLQRHAIMHESCLLLQVFIFCNIQSVAQLYVHICFCTILGFLMAFLLPPSLRRWRQECAAGIIAVGLLCTSPF